MRRQDALSQIDDVERQNACAAYCGIFLAEYFYNIEASDLRIARVFRRSRVTSCLGDDFYVKDWEAYLKVCGMILASKVFVLPFNDSIPVDVNRSGATMFTIYGGTCNGGSHFIVPDTPSHAGFDPHGYYAKFHGFTPTHRVVGAIVV